MRWVSLFQSIITVINDTDGELRYYMENWKVLGSNPTWCSAGLSDLTLLQGSQCPLGQNKYNAVIDFWLVRLPPQQWPKVGHGAVKYQIKK